MEYAILFLPLVGAIFGYFGKSISNFFSEIFTTALTSIAAIFSIVIFYNGIMFNDYGNYKIFEWISSGKFVANWSINIDPLSSVMLVVVTAVSSLVHIYSIGYMSHDPHKPRFMSYLSLFTFSMLALVVSDNFLQLFFGWEGVGLCSYLLIGFWYKKNSANNAAIKAFVVNRVGDFGLAVGIFLIFYHFGTIKFAETFQLASQFSDKKIFFFGFENNLITLI
jgi:NADH-quinone oxidoreductase subunit L